MGEGSGSPGPHGDYLIGLLAYNEKTPQRKRDTKKTASEGVFKAISGLIAAPHPESKPGSTYTIGAITFTDPISKTPEVPEEGCVSAHGPISIQRKRTSYIVQATAEKER